jgi:DNA-binding transcriptional MerR regulator
MFTINTIAKRLGIPAVTLRAWEFRYGVVAPARTGGGHRIYTEEDFQTLLWLKEQVVDRGIPISQAAKLLKQRQEEVNKTNKPLASNVSYEEMAANLYVALLAYDNVRAHAYIDLSFSLFHFEDVFHHILVPILKRVGEEWHDGKVLIAQEHFVSSFAKQRILEFVRLFPIDRTMPKCIAFCPPTETHHIGLLLFTMFMQKKGHEVIYLGPNTTYTHLFEIITETQAELIFMSLTDPRFLKPAQNWLDEALVRYPHLQIVLGGLAFDQVDEPLKSKVLKGNIEDWERWYTEFMRKKKNPSLKDQEKG